MSLFLQSKLKTIFGLLITSTLLFFLASSCKTEKATEEDVVDYKRTDNTIWVHGQAEPDRLNPFLTVNSYSGRALKYIFATLVSYDPKELVLKPYLAKAVPEVTRPASGPYEGKYAYNFEIREEAKWDNGSPVLASDYAFSIKALFAPGVASEVYQSVLNFIVDIEVDAENPRKFTLYSNSFNMNAVYYAGWYVYPEYVYDSEGLLKDVTVADLRDSKKAKQLSGNENITKFADAFNSAKFSREKPFVNGAGPYTFEEWTEGQELKLVKKKDWWGEKFKNESRHFKAEPDQIVFKFIPDVTTAVTALKDEELDVMINIPERQYQELEKNEDFLARYNLYKTPTLSTGYIGLNTENAILEDKKVRQAIAYATNVDEIIETIRLGAAIKGVGPINPNLPYFNESLKAYDYNVEKAKALLAEAGWEDSDNDGIADKEVYGQVTNLSLKLMVPSQSSTIKNIGLLVKNSAQKAGIDFEVVSKDFNVMMKEVRVGEFESFIVSASADVSYYDPYQYWHSESGGNYANFKSEEVDTIIEELISTTDDARRNELYMKFQEIIHEEQPWVMLYSVINGLAVHKRFGNVYTTVARPGYHEGHFEINIPSSKKVKD